jgi:hypothetical protein
MFEEFALIQPWLAVGVLASTAATDAVYVAFTSAVASRHRIAAASWSSIWYLLSSFAVITYTKNWTYVAFAAIGSWVGAYLSITLLEAYRARRSPPVGPPTIPSS